MSPLRLSDSVMEAGLSWSARLLTIPLLGVILAIVIGEGFDPLKLKGVEVFQMVFFWATCVGMVVAWRWPVIGGALSLGGMILFFAVAFAEKGGTPGGLLAYLMLFPGILFLADGFIRRRMAAA